MTIPTHLLESKLITNKEWDEYQELKKIVYDPEDMTLLFMYCGEKAKDKIKQLQQENKQLKERIDKCKHFIETTKENLELIEEDKIAVNLLSLPKVLLKRIEELEKGDSNE